jgi:hypothetical protein
MPEISTVQAKSAKADVVGGPVVTTQRIGVHFVHL